jgi:hypothetical protein
MRTLAIAMIGAAILTSIPLAARATDVAVAVAGPKASGAEKLDSKIRAQLIARDLEVISEKALAKAAKKIDDEAASEAAAKEAGADLLIVVSVKKVKKKFTATATLVDLSSGRTLKTAKRSYKKASSAGAIGDLLGTELGEAAAAFTPGPRTGPDEEPDEQPRSKVIRPKDEETPAQAKPAEPARSTPAITPKDEEKPAEAARTSISAARRGNGEDKVLSIWLGGGSQIASAYTVAVGAQVTGLAYDLTPLMLLDAGVGVQIPGIGLGFELGLAFVPVKYQIDVDPAVDPAAPKGSFFDVGGSIFYELVLSEFGEGNASRFFLTPQLGFSYASLSVEDQEPYAVVLSSSMVAPWGGAKAGLVLGDLAFELEGRFKLVVSYSEAPVETGSDGGGSGVFIGAGARYWVSDNFGMVVRAGYDFARVSFAGEGTRTPFVDDPPLLDASAFTSSLRASVGVILAL